MDDRIKRVNVLKMEVYTERKRIVKEYYSWILNIESKLSDSGVNGFLLTNGVFYNLELDCKIEIINLFVFIQMKIKLTQYLKERRCYYGKQWWNK